MTAEVQIQKMKQKRVTKEERIRQVRMIKAGLVLSVFLIVLIAVIVTISGKNRRAEMKEAAAKPAVKAAVTATVSPTPDVSDMALENAALIQEETASIPDGTGSTLEETASIPEAAGSPGYWTTIDGLTYHMNEFGQPDLGWHLIDGQSCYFDDSGVYIPDAPNDKMVAFTFDDGPSHNIEAILDLCVDTGARVTFFMIGFGVENGGAVIPFLVKYRCGLGNHSYSHTNNEGRPVEETVADFNLCNQWIANFNNGIGTNLIRFPYGNYTQEQLEATGMSAIFWDVDSLDWESQNVEQICERVRSMVTDGSIVLMHDHITEAVEACRILFPELIEQGYQLVTVSELAAAKGVELEPGKAYYDFCGF